MEAISVCECVYSYTRAIRANLQQHNGPMQIFFSWIFQKYLIFFSERYVPYSYFLYDRQVLQRP